MGNIIHVTKVIEYQSKEVALEKRRGDMLLHDVSQYC